MREWLRRPGPSKGALVRVPVRTLGAAMLPDGEQAQVRAAAAATAR